LLPPRREDERREKEERLAVVQSRLNRPLTPAERLMAWHLLEKKGPEEVQAILRQAAAKGGRP
jgi:hypothetical protein